MFTADARHLVHTDQNVVELWPIPPRSWLTSMLWAAGVTLIFVPFALIWRFWPKRKRDTISPTPKTVPTTTAEAAETSHAKT